MRAAFCSVSVTKLVPRNKYLLPAQTDAVFQENLLWRHANARDGKQLKPGENEPNQNPGFVKNGTEPESKKCAQTQNPNPNVTVLTP